jgi:hypothetical protein
MELKELVDKCYYINLEHRTDKKEALMSHLNDLNILESKTSDGLIRIDCGLQENIIESTRNTILTIDNNDPLSIVINLRTV